VEANAVHPSPNELAQFAMGDGPVDASVESHLDGSCSICLLAVNRLRALAAEQPPAHESWLRPTRVAVSHFGRRDVSTQDRHYACRVGNLELNVLVRRDETGARLVVAGQITRNRDVYEPAPAIEVAVVDGDECPVATARSDEFGEFILEVLPRNRFGLRVGDGDGPCVMLWSEEACAS
jgi:hypothetical protein